MKKSKKELEEAVNSIKESRKALGKKWDDACTPWNKILIPYSYNLPENLRKIVKKGKKIKYLNACYLVEKK